jgi:hypothetical protein
LESVPPLWAKADAEVTAIKAAMITAEIFFIWCSFLLACQSDIKVISSRMMLLPVREVASFRHFFDTQAKAAPVD